MKEILVDSDIWIPMYEPECTFVIPVAMSNDVSNSSEPGAAANKDSNVAQVIPQSSGTSLRATLQELFKESDTAPVPKTPLETAVKVTLNVNGEMRSTTARAIVTWCLDGKCISVTLRFPGKAKNYFFPDDKRPSDKDENAAKARVEKEILKFHSEFQKRQTTRLDDGKLRMRKYEKDFFLQTDSVADTLLHYMFAAESVPSKDIAGFDKIADLHRKRLGCLPGQSFRVFQRPIKVTPQSGVLVLAGATKCGKSEVATATILRYLLALAAQKRTVKDAKNDELIKAFHLVTAEDPVEPFKMFDGKNIIRLGPDPDSGTADNESPLSFGIWMTSRAIGEGKDVPDLEHCYKNALRQTPACVFVGETRDAKDWEWVLELGATGHLVVTTMHAGSISEAVGRILTARKIKTAFQRVNLARTLLGVCHLGRVQTKRGTIVLPSLWRRTGMGISAFGSDGLAALVPNRDYLIGRHSIAQTACDIQMEYQDDLNGDADFFRKEARKLDLIEM